ncbi:hypothetical protein RRG08_038400 [Elysia crispata]|uniref:Uncharacterized protein n=1 Tax=Elysia crispata TaxID=231223 RepID=A0AAE1A8Z6_9GAST|nr:hypothetical protein RRG08_038400 [Elysia crispata]
MRDEGCLEWCPVEPRTGLESRFTGPGQTSTVAAGTREKTTQGYPLDLPSSSNQIYCVGASVCVCVGEGGGKGDSRPTIQTKQAEFLTRTHLLQALAREMSFP